MKCTVNSAARKCLAVHTGFGNETFCRRIAFCGGSFFVPRTNHNLYYKEEIYGVFMDWFTVYHMAAGRNVPGRYRFNLPTDSLQEDARTNVNGVSFHVKKGISGLTWM